MCFWLELLHATPPSCPNIRALGTVSGLVCLIPFAPLLLQPTLPMPRSEKSFTRAQHWVAELQRHASQRPLLVLVGNKTDLPAEQRRVAREAAAELADRCAVSLGCMALQVACMTAEMPLLSLG